MYLLGETRFEGVKGFQSLEFSEEADYKEHPLLGAKPALQRVGDKLDTASVTIRLHAIFCNVEDEIDSLRESRRVGYILGLLDENGRYYGDYLVKSVKQQIENQAPDGAILCALVELELVEYYYADRAAAARRQARITGFASTITAVPFPEVPVPDAEQVPTGPPTVNADGSTTPAPVAVQTMTTAAPVTKTREVSTFARLTQIAGTAGRLASSIRSAINDPSRRAYLLRDAGRNAALLVNQHGALIAAVRGIPNPNAAVSNFLYALTGGSGAGSTDVITLGTRLESQANSGDITAAAGTVSELQSEQARLTSAAQPIVTSAAVGRSIL